MSDRLIIRAVSPADAEGLTAMMNLPGYRHGTLRLPFHTVDDVRKGLERERPGSLRLVAVTGGQIVGAAGFDRFEGRRSHCAYVGTGVHDDHTGKGVGKALLAALTDAADNWFAIKRLELTVFTDNELAIRLYERFGFEREGILRAFAFRAGAYADAYSMARMRL
jgi:putative acetyltransferase